MACFWVATFSLAAGSSSQPIWVDVSTRSCVTPGMCKSCDALRLCLPCRDVDGDRRIPGFTSQLLWCILQPMLIEEPLCHQGNEYLICLTWSQIGEKTRYHQNQTFSMCWNLGRGYALPDVEANKLRCQLHTFNSLPVSAWRYQKRRQ